MKLNVNKKSIPVEEVVKKRERSRLERKYGGSVLRHIEKLEKRIEELELKLK